MRFASSTFLIGAGWSLLGLPGSTLSLPHKDSAPLVTVKNGTYKGVYNAHYEQDYFLGVPYAQPPQRFSVAQGLNTSWDGIRLANKYSVHCYGYGYDQNGFKQSEDCLYLNIIRPAGEANSKLPVAAWIHGGGLVMGGAPDPRYNLSFIVEQSVALGTPVIGVSFNYRLSAFGFITGKEVLKDGATNLGFRDQRLALRWISENIAAFGGDPDKVTIFGESSGAESVAAQVFAYNGRDDGLFRGAIAESGFGAPLGRFPGGFNATELMQISFNSLVKSVPSCAKLSGSDTFLECLRKAPFQEIHLALNSSILGQSWAPVLDEDFLVNHTTNQLANGRFLKVPILIGANTDEGTSFGVGIRPKGEPVNTDDQLREALMPMIAPGAEKNTGKTADQLIDELMELYPNDQRVGIPSLEAWPHVIKPGDEYAKQFGLQYRRANAISGDYAMQYQRRRANKAWATHGTPSYAYRFNIRPNNVPPRAGVGHFQEVAFVFYNLNGDGYATNPFGGNGTYPAESKAMAKTISTAWINFVTGLDPNGGSGSELFDGEEWPVFELSDRPDGKGVVFNLNGTHVEVDDRRSRGMNWMADHALPVFGN
ncbi:hypothetical protein F53441_5628 [Fusarium austroafricanum]|uniref:Carboxylic ester hydrolase n=1 Tax=Fusarium austroafricanum TaxID=2364996 RepID=A0A8H4KJ97_9HYPO|nr:hypothetical protein F53441_5628 [Fusarium austroafricanum]